MRTSDSYGLNKERRLAAAERERNKFERANLEPDFPWDVVGFDDRYFGASLSDDPEDSASSGGTGSPAPTPTG